MKSTMKRLAIWGGFVISLSCLYLVFRSVPMAALWEALQQIHWAWIIPSFVTMYLSMAYRGLRWWWLFGSRTGVVPTRVLMEGVLVGYAINNTLPSGRLGEFARALYVSKNRDLTFSRAFGTIVVDRLFDSILILLLIGITAYWILPIGPEVQVEFGGFAFTDSVLNPLFANVAIGSLSVVFGVLVLLIPAVSQLAEVVILKLPFLPASLKERIWAFAEGVFHGLSGVKDQRCLAWATIHTILIWGFNVLAAFTLAWAIPGLELSLFQSLGLVAIVTVCSVVPAAPGAWGLYEAGMIVGFQVLEIHDSTAVALAYGVTMHLLFYVPTTVLGLGLTMKSAIRLSAASKMGAALDQEAEQADG